MSLKPYPKYKDSGVVWLGDVPSGWEVTRLKRVCSVTASNVDKKSYDDQEPVRLCNYTDVYYNHKITTALPFMTATASDEQIEKFTLLAGDVIITKDSETADDIGIPAYVPEDLPGVICGYHLSVLRANRGTEGLFLKYLFESDYLKAKLEVSANGLTRVGLGQSAIENLDVAIPSQGEQSAIAAFLDRETAKIDDLIAQQEKLIALLAEKRQATISHAVTKGLNPEVPMKDSGVEWLGEIPAHWEVKQIRWIAQVLRGKFTHRPRNDPAYYDGDFPFIQTGDITGTSRAITNYRQTLNELGASVSKEFPAGTLVMAIAANIGDVALLEFAAYFPDSIVGLVPMNAVELMYLYFLMQAMKAPMMQTATISTQMNLNVDQITGLRAPLPPKEEQAAIVDFLEREIEKLEVLSNEANRVIDLLKERRTALISAAVTGKIDVREAVSASEAA